MGYVVYRASDTRIVTEKRYGKDVHPTEAAAKAARTRMIRKNTHPGEELLVQSLDAYRMFIEKKVKRINLMSGQEFWESVNTPYYCSPSSETYWSM